MLYLVVFLGGVFLGIIFAAVRLFIKAGRGYFKVEPYIDEDGPLDGVYTVNVRLKPNQDLTKKGMVVLFKEHPHK